MDDMKKMLLALLALAIVVGMYCRSHKSDRLMMPQLTVTPDSMPQTGGMPGVMLQSTTGGLAPADSDPTDFAAYPKAGMPCTMQQPFA